MLKKISIFLFTTFVFFSLYGCGNSARIHLSNGIELYKTKQYERSYNMFQSSIKEDPNIPETYYHLGNLMRDWKGNEIWEGQTGYEHAIQAYTKTIEIQKDNALAVLAYQNRADIHKILAKYDDAIAGYKKVLELNPNSAPAYESLSQIYMEYYNKSKNLMDLVEAKKNIDKAIENNTENINLYRKRAEIYMLQKEYEKAIDDYTKIIKLANRENPNHPDFQALLQRGKAYLELKKYDEAIYDFGECEKNGFINNELTNLLKQATRERKKAHNP